MGKGLGIRGFGGRRIQLKGPQCLVNNGPKSLIRGAKARVRVGSFRFVATTVILNEPVSQA